MIRTLGSRHRLAIMLFIALLTFIVGPVTFAGMHKAEATTAVPVTPTFTPVPHPTFQSTITVSKGTVAPNTSISVTGCTSEVAGLGTFGLDKNTLTETPTSFNPAQPAPVYNSHCATWVLTSTANLGAVTLNYSDSFEYTYKGVSSFSSSGASTVVNITKDGLPTKTPTPCPTNTPAPVMVNVSLSQLTIPVGTKFTVRASSSWTSYFTLQLPAQFTTSDPMTSTANPATWTVTAVMTGTASISVFDVESNMQCNHLNNRGVTGRTSSITVTGSSTGTPTPSLTPCPTITPPPFNFNVNISKNPVAVGDTFSVSVGTSSQSEFTMSLPAIFTTTEPLKKTGSNSASWLVKAVSAGNAVITVSALETINYCNKTSFFNAKGTSPQITVSGTMSTPTYTPTPAKATPTYTPTSVPSVHAWDGNSHSYNVGDLVSYQGHVYKCIQAHTSQSGWDPVSVPALWQYVS